MKLQLTIQSGDGGPLPEGGAVHIEIRDTSLADAPAVTLKRVRVPVPKAGRPVAIELPSVPDGTTVYAHLDADGDGRVSRGDYVTVESYPVTRAPDQHLTLRMRQVR
jgi:putative lipoprotein